MWAKKKRYEEASLCYEYDKLRSSDLKSVLSLFEAKSLIVELIDIRTDSRIINNLQSRSIEYISWQNPSSETYVDIVFEEHFDEGFSEILDEIIESHPKTLILCSTNLSLGQFLYHANRNPLPVQAGVTACVISIEFESNSFSVFFNTELFSQSEIIPGIDHALAG